MSASRFSGFYSANAGPHLGRREAPREAQAPGIEPEVGAQPQLQADRTDFVLGRFAPDEQRNDAVGKNDDVAKGKNRKEASHGRYMGCPPDPRNKAGGTIATSAR